MECLNAALMLGICALLTCAFVVFRLIVTWAPCPAARAVDATILQESSSLGLCINPDISGVQ